MRILVTNDDGIRAEGLYHLAAMAAKLGEVWVVAPKRQASAMSHGITLHRDMELRLIRDFPVDGVHRAYSLDAKPADCVRMVMNSDLMPARPDLVLSGVNRGENAGFDVQYSATVGCGLEALLYDVPAICFSLHVNGSFSEWDRAMEDITRDLMTRDTPERALWNVNFPACTAAECKGILEDRFISQMASFDDTYLLQDHPEEDAWNVHLLGIPVTQADEGSDIQALLDNYISIGHVVNTALI